MAALIPQSLDQNLRTAEEEDTLQKIVDSRFPDDPYALEGVDEVEEDVIKTADVADPYALEGVEEVDVEVVDPYAVEGVEEVEDAPLLKRDKSPTKKDIERYFRLPSATKEEDPWAIDGVDEDANIVVKGPDGVLIPLEGEALDYLTDFIKRNNSEEPVTPEQAERDSIDLENQQSPQGHKFDTFKEKEPRKEKTPRKLGELEQRELHFILNSPNGLLTDEEIELKTKNPEEFKKQQKRKNAIADSPQGHFSAEEIDKQRLEDIKHSPLTVVKSLGVGTIDLASATMFSADRYIRGVRAPRVKSGKFDAVYDPSSGQFFPASTVPEGKFAAEKWKDKPIDEYTTEELIEATEPTWAKHSARWLDKYPSPETREEIAKGMELNWNPVQLMSVAANGAAQNITQMMIQHGLQKAGTVIGPALGTATNIVFEQGMFLKVTDAMAEDQNLSVKQRAKWQQISDKYSLYYGTLSGIIEQIGNAVGPLASKGTKDTREKIFSDIAGKVGMDKAKGVFISKIAGEILGLNLQGTEELSQTAFMNLFMSLALTEMRRVKPRFHQLEYKPESKWHAYANGVLAGGPLSGIGHVLRRRQERKSVNQIKEAINPWLERLVKTETTKIGQILGKTIGKGGNLTSDTKASNETADFEDKEVEHNDIPFGYDVVSSTVNEDGVELFVITPNSDLIEKAHPSAQLALFAKRKAAIEKQMTKKEMDIDGRTKAPDDEGRLLIEDRRKAQEEMDKASEKLASEFSELSTEEIKEELKKIKDSADIGKSKIDNVEQLLITDYEAIEKERVLKSLLTEGKKTDKKAAEDKLTPEEKKKNFTDKKKKKVKILTSQIKKLKAKKKKSDKDKLVLKALQEKKKETMAETFEDETTETTEDVVEDKSLTPEQKAKNASDTIHKLNIILTSSFIGGQSEEEAHTIMLESIGSLKDMISDGTEITDKDVTDKFEDLDPDDLEQLQKAFADDAKGTVKLLEETLGDFKEGSIVRSARILEGKEPTDTKVDEVATPIDDDPDADPDDSGTPVDIDPSDPVDDAPAILDEPVDETGEEQADIFGEEEEFTAENERLVHIEDVKSSIQTLENIDKDLPPGDKLINKERLENLKKELTVLEGAPIEESTEEVVEEAPKEDSNVSFLTPKDKEHHDEIENLVDSGQLTREEGNEQQIVLGTRIPDEKDLPRTVAAPPSEGKKKEEKTKDVTKEDSKTKTKPAAKKSGLNRTDPFFFNESQSDKTSDEDSKTDEDEKKEPPKDVKKGSSNEVEDSGQTDLEKVTGKTKKTKPFKHKTEKIKKRAAETKKAREEKAEKEQIAKIKNLPPGKRPVKFVTQEEFDDDSKSETITERVSGNLKKAKSDIKKKLNAIKKGYTEKGYKKKGKFVGRKKLTDAQNKDFDVMVKEESFLKNRITSIEQREAQEKKAAIVNRVSKETGEVLIVGEQTQVDDEFKGPVKSTFKPITEGAFNARKKTRLGILNRELKKIQDKKEKTKFDELSAIAIQETIDEINDQKYIPPKDHPEGKPPTRKLGRVKTTPNFIKRIKSLISSLSKSKARGEKRDQNLTSLRNLQNKVRDYFAKEMEEGFLKEGVPEDIEFQVETGVTKIMNEFDRIIDGINQKQRERQQLIKAHEDRNLIDQLADEIQALKNESLVLMNDVVTVSDELSISIDKARDKSGKIRKGLSATEVADSDPDVEKLQDGQTTDDEQITKDETGQDEASVQGLSLADPEQLKRDRDSNPRKVRNDLINLLEKGKLTKDQRLLAERLLVDLDQDITQIEGLEKEEALAEKHGFSAEQKRLQKKNRKEAEKAANDNLLNPELSELYQELRVLIEKSNTLDGKAAEDNGKALLIQKEKIEKVIAGSKDRSVLKAKEISRFNELGDQNLSLKEERSQATPERIVEIDKQIDENEGRRAEIYRKVEDINSSLKKDLPKNSLIRLMQILQQMNRNNTKPLDSQKGFAINPFVIPEHRTSDPSTESFDTKFSTSLLEAITLPWRKAVELSERTSIDAREFISEIDGTLNSLTGKERKTALIRKLGRTYTRILGNITVVEDATGLYQKNMVDNFSEDERILMPFLSQMQEGRKEKAEEGKTDEQLEKLKTPGGILDAREKREAEFINRVRHVIKSRQENDEFEADHETISMLNIVLEQLNKYQTDSAFRTKMNRGIVRDKAYNQAVKKFMEDNKEMIPTKQQEWYVHQGWGDPNKESKMDKKDIDATFNSATKEKTFASILDGLEVGYTPRNWDQVAITHANSQMTLNAIKNNAIVRMLKGENEAGAVFITKVTEHKFDDDGEIIKEGNIDDLANAGWTINHGYNILKGQAISPDAKAIIESAFWVKEDAGVESALGKYEIVNRAMKESNLSWGLFHHLTLAQTALGSIGWWETAKTVTNVQLMADAAHRGSFKVILDKWDDASDGSLHGLMLGKVAEIGESSLNDALTIAQDKLSKHLPKKIADFVNAPFEAVKNANDVNSRVLWDYYHNIFKIEGYKSTRDRLLKSNTRIKRLEARKKLGLSKADVVEVELTPEEINILKREAAATVNNQFGGQNWQAMMTNPKMLRTLQNIFLSWDFTKSTFAQLASITGATSVTKTALGRRAQRQMGRAFWVNSAWKYFIPLNMLNALNRYNDDNERWEEEMGFLKTQLAKARRDWTAETATSAETYGKVDGAKFKERLRVNDVVPFEKRIENHIRNKPTQDFTKMTASELVDLTMFGNSAGQRMKVFVGSELIGIHKEAGPIRKEVYRGASKQHADPFKLIFNLNASFKPKFSPWEQISETVLTKMAPIPQFVSLAIWDHTLGKYYDLELTKSRDKGVLEHTKQLGRTFLKSTMPFALNVADQSFRKKSFIDLAMSQSSPTLNKLALGYMNLKISEFQHEIDEKTMNKRLEMLKKTAKRNKLNNNAAIQMGLAKFRHTFEEALDKQKLELLAAEGKEGNTVKEDRLIFKKQIDWIKANNQANSMRSVEHNWAIENEKSDLRQQFENQTKERVEDPDADFDN